MIKTLLSHCKSDVIPDITVKQHLNQLISLCSDDYAHIQSFVIEGGIQWLKNELVKDSDKLDSSSFIVEYHDHCVRLLVTLCSYEKFVSKHISMTSGVDNFSCIDFENDICAALLRPTNTGNTIYYGILSSIHIIKYISDNDGSTSEFTAIGLSKNNATVLLNKYIGLLQHLKVNHANIHIIQLLLNTIVSMVSSSVLDYIGTTPCPYLLGPGNLASVSRYESMENRKIRFVIEEHMRKRSIGYSSILIKETPFVSIIINIIDSLYSNNSKDNSAISDNMVDNAIKVSYILAVPDSSKSSGSTSTMDGYQQSFIVCLSKVFLAFTNEDEIKGLLEKEYMQLPHVEQGVMPTATQYGVFRRKAVVQMCLLTSMQATLGSWSFLHKCGSEEVNRVEELNDDGSVSSQSSNPLLHLLYLLASPDYYNQNLASEVLCLAASEPSCHSTLSPLVESSTLTQLLHYSPYVATRTAIASTLTKLGLKASALKETSEEISSYLNIISDTLKLYISNNSSSSISTACAKKGDKSNNIGNSGSGLVSFSVFDNIAHNVEQTNNQNLNAHALDNGIKPNLVKLSSLERVVEMLAALSGKTHIKEEVTFGSYRIQSIISELVSLLNIVSKGMATGTGSGAGSGSGSGSGVSRDEALHSPTVLYGLLHTFALLTVSNKELHAKALAEKDMTYEQYTEMKKLHRMKAKQEANAAAGRDKDAPEGEPDAADDEDDDTDEKCKKRILKIVSCESIKAFVGLLEAGRASNSVSVGAIELVCKICRQISVSEVVRGHIIQQGGLKVLIDVACDVSADGSIRREAAHCIAKTLVTTNPILLKEHQRLSAIRSLLYLCKEHDATDLQQFESLLSLTNLLSVGQPEKDCFLSKVVDGLNTVHYKMFSDHMMVRRAATECLCNIAGEEAFHKLLRDPSKVKFWVGLVEDYDSRCGEMTDGTSDAETVADMEESFKTARAISGTLAVSCHDVLVTESCMKEGLGEVLIHVLSRQFDVPLMTKTGGLSITIQKHFEVLHRIFEMIYQMCSCEYYCCEDGTPFSSQQEADILNNSDTKDRFIMKKRNVIATQLMTAGLLPTIQMCFSLYTLSHKNKKPVNLLPVEIIETATNICGILQYFSN